MFPIGNILRKQQLARPCRREQAAFPERWSFTLQKVNPCGDMRYCAATTSIGRS
jgi:hypothetical protein